MRSIVKLAVIFMGVIIVAFNALLLLHAHEAQTQLSDPPLVRTRFNLPGLFDFSQFKKHFGKVYNSFLEGMVRQKILLGRAFKVFVSFVEYKHFKRSYYLSLNEDSDETPIERKRKQIHISNFREPLDDIVTIAEIDHATKISAVTDEDEIPVAQLDDIEREFVELEKQKEERPEIRDLVVEIEELKVARRKKRNTISDQNGDRKIRQNVSVDYLLVRRKSELPDEVAIKIRPRPASNNPTYEQPELSSSASTEQLNGAQREAPDENFLNLVSKLPGSTYVKSVIDNSFSLSSSQEEDQLKKQEKIIKLPDEIFSDLRQTNCFFPPRKQIGCGCCYAFTAIAYYEFIYCKYTGSLVPFSEQYIVDCGYLKSLDGCTGGLLSKTVSFVEQFGLELRNNYPYRAFEDACPYEENPDPIHMGYIKLINRNGYGALALKDFDLYLKEKPIMFGLKLSPDFHDYGGGVDDAIGCNEEDGHAMLIVGHGREDGKDYYLFRNSYSEDWGEQGYYKLNKASLERCAANKFGVASQVKFRKSETKNRNTMYKTNRKML